MEELIKVNKIKIENELVYCVNARELHEFLQVQSKFADWIKNRIDKYDFQENKDYVLVSKNLETSSGGTFRKEYYLTLDTAKELGMIENNERGRQVRRYFIEVEKRYKAGSGNGLETLRADFITRFYDMSIREYNVKHAENLRVKLDEFIESITENDLKAYNAYHENLRNALTIRETLVAKNVHWAFYVPLSQLCRN